MTSTKIWEFCPIWRRTSAADIQLNVANKVSTLKLYILNAGLKVWFFWAAIVFWDSDEVEEFNNSEATYAKPFWPRCEH